MQQVQYDCLAYRDAEKIMQII